MKKLNQKATRVFCQLLQNLSSDFRQFTSEGFMPLILVKRYGGVNTAIGEGVVYHLAHTYLQNGDTMNDPCMGFLVIGFTKNCDYKAVEIYPHFFQQDNAGIYEESIIIKDGTMTHFNLRLQADHTSFANFWLQNIRHQDFIP